MRFLGMIRPKTQAYTRKAGARPPLTTFRGPSPFTYETIGVPDSYTAPIVYACVSRISNTISQMPRTVRRERDNMEVDKPAWIERPNAFQGGEDFIKSIVASMLLWGEAFLIPFRGPRMLTESVAVLNPTYMTHHVRTGTVVWYINGIEYEGELIHLRNDALPGRVRGYPVADIFTPLTATNRVAQEFVYQVVEQGAAYQIAILFPEDVDEDAVDSTVASVMARHAGPDGAYKPLILSGGATIETLNQSNADAQFIDLSDMTGKQIAQFWFGVDETMLGFKSDQPQIYQNAPSIWYRYYTFACKHIVIEIERALSLCLVRGQMYDLAESAILLGGPHERTEMVERMAGVNKTMGHKIFVFDELREVAGMKPLPKYEPLEKPAPPPPPNGMMIPPGMKPAGGEQDSNEQEDDGGEED